MSMTLQSLNNESKVFQPINRVFPGMTKIVKDALNSNSSFVYRNLADKKEDIAEPQFRKTLSTHKQTNVEGLVTSLWDMLGELEGKVAAKEGKVAAKEGKVAAINGIISAGNGKSSSETLGEIMFKLGKIVGAALTMGAINAALAVVDEKTISDGCSLFTLQESRLSQEAKTGKNIVASQSKATPGMAGIIKKVLDLNIDFVYRGLADHKDKISGHQFRENLLRDKVNAQDEMMTSLGEIASELEGKVSQSQLKEMAGKLGIAMVSALTIGSINAALAIIDDKTIIPGCER